MGVANGPPGGPAARRGGFALAAIAVLALTFTFSGAYDTDTLPLGHRLALWTLVSLLAAGQPLLLQRLSRAIAPPSIAMASALSASTLLLTVQLQALKLTPLLPKAIDPWPAFFAFVAPPGLAIGAFMLLADALIARPARPGAAPTSRIAAPVLWARAHDHYVELMHADGRTFRRGRFSDVVASLDEASGMQVHRSWWVADRAVAAARRRGRDYVLILNDGSTVPVGRARHAELRARGWLDRRA